MKYSRLALVAALVAVVTGAVFWGCGGGSGDRLSGQVEIAGSSTVYLLAQAAAEEFSKLHPRVQVSVNRTGTGGGFSNWFIPGRTDINTASRPIKESELQKCKKNGVTPIELPVAIDAVTVVTNPKADFVSCLTMDQLKEIWGPDNPPQKWSEVRSQWPGEDLELYGPASTSGTFDFFTERVMGEEDAHRGDYQATEHDNTIVQGVEGSRYALGYFGYAYYSKNKERLKALKIDGGEGCVEPSLETAQDDSYPLSRPLYIYVNEKSLEKPEVRAFVEFFIRKSATDLVSQVGYVPVTEEIKNENLRKIGVKQAEGGGTGKSGDDQ